MSRIKHKRKVINLETKIQILALLAKGKGSTAVGRHFGIQESTIRTIKKNENAIIKSVYSGANLNAKSVSYTRDIVKVKMEQALAEWMEDNMSSSTPMNISLIKEKALGFFKHFKEVYKNDTRCARSVFYASSGWLRGFRKRYNLIDLNLKNETSMSSESDNKVIEWYNDGEVDEDDMSNIRISKTEQDLDSEYHTTLSPELCSSILFHDKEADEDSQSDSMQHCDIKFIDDDYDDIKPKLEPNTDCIYDSDIEEPDVFYWNNSEIELYEPKMSKDLIKEGLRLAKKLGEHFRTHDHNDERAKKFQHELNLLMNTYREANAWSSDAQAGGQVFSAAGIVDITSDSSDTD